MTENLTDGVVAQEGQAESPTPASSPVPQQPFEGDVNSLLTKFTEQVDARFSALEKKYTEGIGRAQGAADRATSEFRKWVGEVEKLEKTGLTRDDAIATLEARQQQDQWRVNIEKQLTDLTSMMRSGGNGASVGQIITEVLSEYDLNPADPYVAAQLKGKTFGNRTEAELFAARVFRDKARSPSPTPAQNATPPGAPGASADIGSLAAEYDRLAKNPTAPGAIDRMSEIAKELEKI